MRRIVKTRDNRFRVFDRLSLSFVTTALPISEFVKDFGVQISFAVSNERDLYKLYVYESEEAALPICTINDFLQQGNKAHDQSAFTVRTSDEIE